MKHTFFSIISDGAWTMWSSAGSLCSVTCGPTAVKEETRTCEAIKAPEGVQTCNPVGTVETNQINCNLLSCPGTKSAPKFVIKASLFCPFCSTHKVTVRWREVDLSCGGGFIAADGLTTPAECNPDESLHQYCCSEQNICGAGAAACDCTNCVDWRVAGM